ncbi:MAG: Hsp33 family molecular chaperone HslO [Gammaproteobacteria bacterium]|nr:Hsp33 family molecular chaperone HslO [Gammaproteobacteria bacterium]
MKKSDQIQRFLFQEHAIRGQHISLDSSWQQIARQSGVEGLAQTLLGQALCAAALLVDTLKINGSVSMQIRGSGAIHLLIVEATSGHSVRGLVRQSAPLEEQQSLADVFESDKLVITIKDGKARPHQGIVPLVGDSLAEALQAYFNQSEQLPTRLWFACNSETVAGLLIQQLPEESRDEDAWNRICILAETTQPEELLGLCAEQLLQRLFHEEQLRLFEADTICFNCSCSLERTRDMLVSLGKAEIDDIIAQQQQTSITCEFCNKQYHFDKVDLELLFQDEQTILSSSKQH